MDRIRRNLLAGLLVLIPIWVSIWLVWLFLDLLVAAGRPLVSTLATALRPTLPSIAELLTAPWFQSLTALVIVLGLLYALGAATNAVLGRRLLRLVDRLMENTPLVKTIYTATRTLIESVQGAGATESTQRVCLIEFPTPEMRALGFVTRIFNATDTGEELAAVYVPTTPNPTSGYLEIVPTARIVWLDWSANEAMSFIVSGGALAPKGIPMIPNERPSPLPETPTIAPAKNRTNQRRPGTAESD